MRNVRWFLGLVATGLLLGVVDNSSSSSLSHNEEMMPMMQMCHQMMERMFSGGMPHPMSPEGREIAKLRADAEVKEAQLRRMLLEDNIHPDTLKEKIKEIHDLHAEIQFREIMLGRAKATAHKPSGKEGMPEEHTHHHSGGMGMMGR
ncbi:MAG: hypothetical protein V2G33_04225 [bacterium JZ-2024 1]